MFLLTELVTSPPASRISAEASSRVRLGNVPVTTLPDEATGDRASLERLAAHLRDGAYDILYLVGHGSLVDGEPWLWLEDDATGEVARVSGNDLVERVRVVFIHRR